MKFLFVTSGGLSAKKRLITTGIFSLSGAPLPAAACKLKKGAKAGNKESFVLSVKPRKKKLYLRASSALCESGTKVIKPKP